MTLFSQLSNMGGLLAAMAVVAAVEAVLPLRSHAGWNRAHLTANLALTLVTFATNAVLSAALVVLFAALESAQLGLLHALPLAAPWSTLVAVLALDLAFYAFHVSMHKSDALWRFHRVHHCDPALDVTSSFRQHPGEGVVRAAFHAAFGAVFGVAPAAYALYRSLSALAAIAEHANVRVPRRLDDALSLVVTFPTLHKVHHARDRRLHDTNFGNLVSWWDRLFATFTPAREGARVDYGLDGFDDPGTQSTRGLLALPLRTVRARPDHA
jgi:sterol desaturase/sphingolipid hydroxylase (fatty acid hydroxylase superfamily)